MLLFGGVFADRLPRHTSFFGQLANGWREVTRRNWVWSSITVFMFSGLSCYCSSGYHCLGIRKTVLAGSRRGSRTPEPTERRPWSHR